jgi:hypothetical protein
MTYVFLDCGHLENIVSLGGPVMEELLGDHFKQFPDVRETL